MDWKIIIFGLLAFIIMIPSIVLQYKQNDKDYKDYKEYESNSNILNSKLDKHLITKAEYDRLSRKQDEKFFKQLFCERYKNAIAKDLREKQKSEKALSKKNKRGKSNK